MTVNYLELWLSAILILCVLFVLSLISRVILGQKPKNIQNESVDSNELHKVQKDNNIPIAAFDFQVPEKDKEPIVSNVYPTTEGENEEIKKSFKPQKCSICMNPNLKNLTVCEYCGNQIF
jgi:hypothetical protein